MASETIRIKTVVDDQASNALLKLKNVIGLTFGALSVRYIADMSVKLIKLSSDAKETANKFNEVFKGVTNLNGKIQDLRKESGYAKSTLQMMSSNIGALIKPLGLSADKTFDLSKRIVKLSYDLASFHNLQPDQVIQDFQSALAGSSETLQKYGIDARETTLAQKAFNMGLIDSEKAYSRLDPEQRRQVRTMALIEKAYEDSTSAVGDLARTADSTANATRTLNENIKELSENLGSHLEPMANKAVTAINKLFVLFDQWQEKREQALRQEAEEGKDFFKIPEIELPKELQDKKQVGIDLGITLEAKDAIDELTKVKKELTVETEKNVVSEEELKKAFIAELEWLDKLTAKNKAANDMRLEAQRQYYDELEELKKEANENLEKLRQEDLEATQARADESYEIAKKANENEDRLKEESLRQTQRGEQQKRWEQRRSLDEFQENLRIWGQESRTAFEMYKAWASAEALISAAKSAQSIFEAVSSQAWLGPVALPAAIAAAGVAMAAGMARTGMIASQDYQGRASGGDVQAGMPYVVGERGREMFIPDISGYIIPNNALKKLGGKSVVINVNALDIQSFRDFLRKGGANVLESEVSKGRLF